MSLVRRNAMPSHRVGLTIALIGVCALLSFGVVCGQEAGDTIVVAVPATTDVTTGPDGDKVVFVGRAGVVVDA